MSTIPETTLKDIEIEMVYGILDNEGKKTYLSLKQEAEKYNVSYGELRKAASKWNWRQRRTAHRTKVDQKVDEKKSEYDAEQIVLADEKFEDTFEKARKVGDIKLDQQLERVKEGKHVPGHEYLNTVSALRGAQEGLKTAQGDNAKRIKIESNNNDELLNDPNYIQAKKKAMDDYYANQQGGTD